MEQQFSLSWNNFHGNLTKGFAGLLGNGEFVDVTIAVEGHLLQAHKVILSICSPYFKKMFQMNPCQHPIVVLRDVTHKAMKDLLQFMYHGEVSVKREELTSFIGTAEVLQIKGLTNKEPEEDTEKNLEQSPKQTNDTQNHTPEETNTFDPTEDSQTNELDILKQRQLIDKLHRISTLKRKSEEFLQKTFYSNLINTDKKIKLHDKPQYKNHLLQSNNFVNYKNYDDEPLDVTNYKQTHTNVMESNDKNEQNENSVEVKTECDDMDIIVTDPAVCSPAKSFDGSREKRDLLPMDYTTPQDSALSLVVNGSKENQHLPARYKYIYSRKGHKQLVHMNFVYTKHSTTHGKTSWRCVQYFSLNRCPATIETIDSMIYAVNHQHNHEDCFEKISRNNVYEMNANSSPNDLN